MPCYRCGTRQVDPDRGESPWRRGVRGDRQVLICPDCQVAVDWAAELDRCQTCGSMHLVRRLGEVECRDCGAVGQPAEDVSVTQDGAIDRMADLAEEVERALAKVLGPSSAGATVSPSREVVRDDRCALVGRLLDEYHERSVPPVDICVRAGSEHELRVSYRLTLPTGPGQIIRAFRADAPVPENARGPGNEIMTDWLVRARTHARLP